MAEHVSTEITETVVTVKLTSTEVAALRNATCDHGSTFSVKGKLYAFFTQVQANIDE